MHQDATLQAVGQAIERFLRGENVRLLLGGFGKGFL